MTIKSLLITMGLVCASWIGILALVAVLGGDAPAYVVLFPMNGFLTHLPPEVAISSVTTFSTTVNISGDFSVAELYAAGAWLVLPAGLEGCFS
jgi:hypothetical protein